MRRKILAILAVLAVAAGFSIAGGAPAFASTVSQSDCPQTGYGYCMSQVYMQGALQGIEGVVNLDSTSNWSYGSGSSYCDVIITNPPCAGMQHNMFLYQSGGAIITAGFYRIRMNSGVTFGGQWTWDCSDGCWGWEDWAPGMGAYFHIISDSGSTPAGHKITIQKGGCSTCYDILFDDVYQGGSAGRISQGWADLGGSMVAVNKGGFTSTTWTATNLWWQDYYNGWHQNWDGNYVHNGSWPSRPASTTIDTAGGQTRYVYYNW